MCERQEAAEDIRSRSLVFINRRQKTEELISYILLLRLKHVLEVNVRL